MISSNSDKISTTQILVPMLVMALTMTLLMAFQMTQVVRERDNLNQAVGRMEAPLTESQKLNAQFGGLVIGTQKLASEGNKIALEFVERLKKLGIIMEPQGKPAVGTPVPAAQETPSIGPVKP